MDDSGSPNSASEFTLAEIVEMESIYKELEGESLGRDFCKDLAMRFSCSSNRGGKFATITCEQVQNWFRDKHEKLHPESSVSSTTLALVIDLPGSCMQPDEPETSQKPKEDKIWKCSEIVQNDDLIMSQRIKGLHELAFEALSSKDYAWYDVATFLTCRVNNTGELEVRVRFSGFGKEEDEWVNMRSGLRERSIPLEPSECHKVKVGDLVLCFREREQFALYADAHIVRIERKLHDLNACECIFIVRYEYDEVEEEVDLDRMCCRPAGSDPPNDINSEDLNLVNMNQDWNLSFLY